MLMMMMSRLYIFYLHDIYRVVEYAARQMKLMANNNNRRGGDEENEEKSGKEDHDRCIMNRWVVVHDRGDGSDGSSGRMVVEIVTFALIPQDHVHTCQVLLVIMTIDASILISPFLIIL